MVTADGPRIRDVEVYAICARDEYGAYPHTLRVWTFDEEEQLHQLAVMVSTGPPLEVTAAPPHHRLGRLERPGRPGR